MKHPAVVIDELYDAMDAFERNNQKPWSEWECRDWRVAHSLFYTKLTEYMLHTGSEIMWRGLASEQE